MTKKNEIPDFEGMAKQLKRDAVKYASGTGLNHFQDSFYNQGFTDKTFIPWLKRANDLDPGRSILVKSAFLLNSLQVFDANEKQITFGSDDPKAALHNEGGTVKITVTEKMRKYFWFMFNATGEERFKAMALTKKDAFVINIPQRQFIGHSETLMDNLDNWLINQIEKRFKRL